jgi:xylulokinase
MPDLLLGIDCSITAAKAMAWDGSGKVRAEGRASLEEIRPRPGYSEQRAEDWWQATANAVAELMRTVPGDRITGICITHQRESFVPVDDHNRPLRNAILWDDARSQVRLDQLGDQLGHDELHRRTGRGPSIEKAVSKLLWLLEHEPAVVAGAHKCMDVYGFLVQRLTGHYPLAAGRPRVLLIA